jgi:potassium uptake Trk family protein
MSLLDANMVAYQTSYYLLLTMGLLILAGNTAYPIFLRLIVWCMFKVTQYFAGDDLDEDHPWTIRLKTLKFLLDHPRRCYTNMFPAQHTWWLALTVFTLNAIDWALFEILNIGNHKLSDGLPLKFRVIDGLFQALAVRSGGFYVVTISNLRISLQVLYVVMMYISAYPVSITIRNSNVYEERSLGIYEEDNQENDNTEDQKPTSAPQPGLLSRAKTIGNHFVGVGVATAQHENNGRFVRQQLRAQLAHDAWWIVLAVFLVMICETSHFDQNPTVYSVFNVIFEIVSAYGCVGISVGVPWNAYSFCGAWTTLSKLILCAVMLRGRHRGLPVAIDKAVLLPGEKQGNAEEEDGRIRIAKTLSRARTENALV